jgi:uncharacterized protein YecE (DUF72 family)
MIWIGTSGFQYPEWKGKFYPSDLSAKKMLPYYAARFRTTEINYTFYRIPSVTTLSKWSAETPDDFRFTLKAPKQITHVKQLRDCEELLARFWNVAVHLKGKLGAVLFQLPPYFKKDVSVLAAFLDLLPSEIKSAFEFRHESWFDEQVFTTLRTRNAALCVADSEKLRTPVVVTADYGYFRLRDESYTEADIERWAAIIAKQQKESGDVYVYFKHEESGIGPKFATLLMAILGGRRF